MPAPDTPKKTVLVAADAPFVRDRFKTALDRAGLGAFIVKSVAELLARVRADLEAIDLVVIDLKMPHARGADLVRTIRKLDENRLPILVFSGSVSSADEVKELAALGVSGYLNEYTAVEHIVPSIAPHLFGTAPFQRKSPRVVMGIPVSYRTGRSIAAALSLDLSKGGMGIRTKTPLRPETELAVRFTLPGAKKEIAARAVVCWSSQEAGMGLRFTQIKPADQEAIDAFVDAHFFRGIKD